jgi:hypothetical protein
MNWPRPDQGSKRELFWILPPLTVVVILALLFLLALQRGPSFSETLIIYFAAAIPHFVALILLFTGSASIRGFVAGFLGGFWCAIVAYLLFIGLFLFSVSESGSHGNQKLAWCAGVAMGIWMVIGSLFSARLNKASYVTGVVIGFIYPMAVITQIAMLQRRH